MLGRAFKCDSLSTSANNLPISRELILQLLNSNKKVYKEYVVCPKCDSLYQLKDCIKLNPNGTTESKTCCHVATPDHLHRSRRVACGCVLLRRQGTKKRVILTPRKVFLFMSVKRSLENLLNRPGFVNKCELWRSRRDQTSEYLGDVYDGEVWKKFNSRKLNNFLSTPH